MDLKRKLLAERPPSKRKIENPRWLWNKRKSNFTKKKESDKLRLSNEEKVGRDGRVEGKTDDNARRSMALKIR